jgi:hypothetical protein
MKKVAARNWHTPMNILGLASELILRIKDVHSAGAWKTEIAAYRLPYLRNITGATNAGERR